MPPKKEAVKKTVDDKMDESNMLKNWACFKFTLEAKLDNCVDTMVMFEWFTVDPKNPNVLAYERSDTPLLETWAPKVAGDPTTVIFEKTFDALRLDDNFAKALCNKKFYVYFVSIDDNTVKDSLMIDYSSLLFDKTMTPTYVYENEKVKVQGLESFKLTLVGDNELMTPIYRHYLNPIQVTVVGGKNLPTENAPLGKYLPVYVQYSFYDGTTIRTDGVPHGNTCKWLSKHVLLAGFMDQVKLKEYFSTAPLRFELHDKDEIAKDDLKKDISILEVTYTKEEDPKEIDPKDAKKGGKGGAAKPPPEPKKDDKAAAKKKEDEKKKKKDPGKMGEPILPPAQTRPIISNNYGYAEFVLADFVKPNVLSIKLRSGVAPVQKFEDKEYRNLDLNTTARRELKKQYDSDNYVEHETFLVIGVDISFPVGTFKAPERPVEVVPEKGGKADPKKKAPEPAKAPPPAAAKDAKDPRPPSQQAGQRPPSQEAGAKKNEIKHDLQEDTALQKALLQAHEIYERSVYIMPYKSPEFVAALQDAIQEINLAAFNIVDGTERDLNTKVLSENDKKNLQLDYIGGFELIDGEFRVYMLEGLAAKGMKLLESKLPRTDPNNEKFRILRNLDVKFKERIFMEFNVAIKRIKLRTNLAKLMMNPNIYLRTKTPENIFATLSILQEMRRCWNMKDIVHSNLFPNTADLLSLERKYGDALTDEDIYGAEKEATKKARDQRRAMEASKTEAPVITAIPAATPFPLSAANILSPQTESPVLMQTGDTNQKNTKRLASMGARSLHETYNLHITKTNPNIAQNEVFIYASQSNNMYERQKAELREKILNDKNHLYTYSKEYLSLSINPVDPDALKREEEKARRAKFVTPEGFQTILKKDKNEYTRHPKAPAQSIVEEIANYPWHESNATKLELTKSNRAAPIKDKKDFQVNVGKISVFSNPEVLEAEKITAVEREAEIRKERNREHEDWKAKLVVENPHFFTNTLVKDKPDQLDKLNGIRDGPAVKHGIMMKEARLKSTTIPIGREVGVPPPSYNLVEDWVPPVGDTAAPLKFDPTKSIVPHDFVRHSHIEGSLIYKPMKNPLG